VVGLIVDHSVHILVHLPRRGFHLTESRIHNQLEIAFYSLDFHFNGKILVKMNWVNGRH
jgi:hypothetical protein